MPRLLVDFDATLHKYSKGWHDGTAYDPPFDDALDGINTLISRGYEVVIFSTRPADQIRPWLALHGFPDLPITDRKLPATAIIDDRAIHHLDWRNTLDVLARRYPAAPHGVVGSTRTPGNPGRKEH